jgi:hypothetical protein
MIVSIDPGATRSALVWLRDGMPVRHELMPNEDALLVIRNADVDCVVCEMIASYGMSVGAEVFDTCVQIGRFMEASPSPFARMFRKEVKMHLCGRNNANDSNIRRALIDRYGPSDDVAIGVKARPGPLYGIKADRWAALAVAVTWSDLHQTTPSESEQMATGQGMHA